MTPRNVIRFVVAVVCAVGVVLLTSSGLVASALGARGGGAAAGASDPESMAFWFQLAFMRLFGTCTDRVGRRPVVVPVTFDKPAA
jgi:hypothetical protein